MHNRFLAAHALATLILLVPAGSSHGQEAARAPARPAASLVAEHLETNAATEPLGIDDRTPRLSWRLVSSRRGVRQSTYQVLVATRPELLREGRADVWDSRTTNGDDPWTTYAGKALTSRSRYYWTVRVRPSNGPSSAWARPSWFETAQLDSTEWRGRWIAGPERAFASTPAEGMADDERIRASREFCRPTAWPTVPLMRLRPNDQGECRAPRPAPMLRRSFVVTKPIARARLYASGLGYGDYSINGAPTSDRVLDPQFTNYSRTVLYTTTDVTRLLRRGENVIGAVLGSGKFDDAATTWDWGWDKAEWRGTPRLRLDLVVTYADGNTETIASDSTWRVSVDGPWRYDSFYLGETYDARRTMRGWSASGFDASRWSAARVVTAPAGVLRAEAAEPSRVVAVRGPGKRTEPVNGVVVYDIGQNLSGWATIRVRAPAGTAIEVFYSEKLAADGRASTESNALVAGQLQTDYYVARGGAEETWAPRFTYKGFQYVQLSAPNGAPLPRSVSISVASVQQVRTALATTSTFASSNPLLDRIERMTSWSIQSNVQSGIITDTPIYEKNPWTGDAQLSAGAASTMFDTRRLYAKLFQDMRDAQSEQGEVPLLAPSNENYGYVGKPAFKPVECCGATPAWDAFWFVVPWEAYQRFGDRRALETTYPAMRRYLDDWIPRWTTRDGDDSPYTLTAGLGDWDPPPGTDPVIKLSSTAYYALFARIAADGARVLGNSADAARYDTLFTRIRTAFNAKFLTAEGVYRDTTTSTGPGGPPPAVLVKPPVGALQHTSQLLPLAFGLAPDSLRAPLAARLASDVERMRGGNAFVGILGARYFHPVLTEMGHANVAYTAATQRDYPSYGYWADSLGWTTLAEYWEPTSRSRNHHMFGAIAQWFYEHLAGIRATAPGYRQIEIRPTMPAGLDSVSASVETVRGPVATRWRRTAAGLELDVTIPPTSTARVYVPASNPGAVTEIGAGRVEAAHAQSVTLIGAEGDRVVYEVGSGQYRFRAAR
ncbi:MAG TPA: family 78 glycoside hydrolase catalytic domain [Gemmatimonadaceae bacterium]|nr:family 78 glycoside hydrolase catalytic domain [Gemmatimonadaceae bacterium]